MIATAGMRIDKWLWAARFFKTRSLATHACDLGRIHWNGQQSKPAREVRAGDLVTVRSEGAEFEVEVLGLSEMRGPAPAAQALYRETDKSRAERLRRAEERKTMSFLDGLRDGKPSKKDRRAIDRFRGRY